MTKSEFIGLLENNLGFPPTEGQSRLFRALTEHLSKPVFDNAFVIRGYAGTGKTSIVRSLVKTLPKTSLRTVLLAPTGRAAKVLASYTGKPAFTIHKKIYFAQASEHGLHFQKQKNKHKSTVFIVDEASMIGAENYETETNLLGDLLEYVASGENCRLILIGDSAQLPPVGSDESPALNPEFLNKNYFLHIDQARLHEVMRQRLESGILFNATKIREQIHADKISADNISADNLSAEVELSDKQFSSDKPGSGKNSGTFPRLSEAGFEDVKRITGLELEDELNNAYSTYGEHDVLVVTRSNKNANHYNRQIRARIKWQEENISTGDLIMAVKNNYFWLPENSGPGFIANGDIIEIQRLIKHYERGPFKFVDAEIKLLDYPDAPEFEVRLMLNSLDIEQASMPFNKLKELRALVEEDYLDIKNKRKRYAQMKKDPFLNALQIKFAYAVTCHKAQGGQWKCVFIDQGYLTDDTLDRNYLRWLYTAITRASEKVYLVNFNARFFEDKL